MNKIITIIAATLLLFAVVSSCKKKDEKICPNSVCSLSFDADTVIFDTTVFVGVKTITKRLTVYNFNDYALDINEISIPSDSPFKLIINGERTNSAKNITLRGNDKMLILVEAIFDENQPEDSIHIVEEDLKFDHPNGEQIVKLVAPTLNVYFHNAEILPCNAVWKSDYPHLIYNSVLVPDGCKLTIEEGASIFSSARSAILVEGAVQALGSSENKIIFTDARVDKPDVYGDIFGIWEGILLLPGSTNNKFDWVTINNAVNGIRVNYFNQYDIDDEGNLITDPDYNIDMSGGSIELELSHSIINTIGNNINAPNFTGGLPFSGIGLIGRNCDMIVHNSLITNCTVGSMMVLLNGTYQIANNTFTNYPNANASFNRPKEVQTFYASTILADASSNIEGGNMTLLMENNIIYGQNSATEPEDTLDELVLSSTEEFQLGVIGFSNNIIKTSEYDSLLQDFNIINKNPFPANVNGRSKPYDFTLDEGSIAINAGFVPNIMGTTTELNVDLAGNNRDNFWDVGAYEYVP